MKCTRCPNPSKVAVKDKQLCLCCFYKVRNREMLVAVPDDEDGSLSPDVDSGERLDYEYF